MDEQPEVIQHQMEETRQALVDKLEALENQVAETVQSTTHAVQDTTSAVTGTVEAVKDTVENVSEKVQETMATVTDTLQQTAHAVSDTVQQTAHAVSEAFDLRLQAERHPWLVVGGAVAVGYTGALLLDSLLGRSATPRERPAQGLYGGATARAEAPSNGQSIGNMLPDWLRDELGRLRGVAIGSVMSMVRDLARQAMPGPIGQRLAEEVDVVTSKLGGEKIPSRSGDAVHA